MDPITAGLNLANGIVTLLTRIWDATPEAEKVVRAADVAKALHRCSAFLESVQARIAGEK